MMGFRRVKHKLTTGEIIFIGILGIVFVFFSRISLRIHKTPYFDLKLKASQRTLEAYNVVKELRLSRDIKIDPVDDPMESGIIGIKDSPITTTTGDYEAKLTSVNPNWSAAVIDMLINYNIKPGDGVVVFMTGSFPALNIAVLMALETYGVKVYHASSLGSSSWGANIPDLTWLDMEDLLYKKGLIKHKSLAASIGGNSGVGAGLPPEGKEVLKKSIEKNNVKLFYALPLQKLVNMYYDLFNSCCPKPKLFINVGGSVISLGTSDVSHLLEIGWNPPKNYLLIKDEPVEGLVAKYLKKGVPVVHIHDIVRLAKRFDLPIAPAVMPEPGTGRLFYKERYPVGFHLILLGVFLLLVILTANGFFSKKKERNSV